MGRNNWEQPPNPPLLVTLEWAVWGKWHTHTRPPQSKWSSSSTGCDGLPTEWGLCWKWCKKCIQCMPMSFPWSTCHVRACFPPYAYTPHSPTPGFNYVNHQRKWFHSLTANEFEHPGVPQYLQPHFLNSPVHGQRAIVRSDIKLIECMLLRNCMCWCWLCVSGIMIFEASG
jgi:hypothetical protein